jgi:hypothetical protein
MRKILILFALLAMSANSLYASEIVGDEANVGTQADFTPSVAGFEEQAPDKGPIPHREIKIKPRKGIRLLDVDFEGAKKLSPLGVRDEDDSFLQLDNDRLAGMNADPANKYAVAVYSRLESDILEEDEKAARLVRLKNAYPGKRGYALFVVDSGSVSGVSLAYSRSALRKVEKLRKKVIRQSSVTVFVGDRESRAFFAPGLIDSIIDNF